MQLNLLQNTDPQTKKITEDTIFQPLTNILEKPLTNMNVTQSLNELFPEQQGEEKNIKKAKEILGEQAVQFTSEQLRDMIAEMQFLINNSLDNFEQSIFDGITLKELLHEKNL